MFKKLKELFSSREENDEILENEVNKYLLLFHAKEIDLKANLSFQEIEEEDWFIGEKTIKTPHGILKIEKATIISSGPQVGIEFAVKGKLDIHNLKCCKGDERPVSIKTLAVVRQPNNVWVWVYAFDKHDKPIFNFCGNDDYNFDMALSWPEKS